MDKFGTLLIPDIIRAKGVPISPALVTLIPYTPLNLAIFLAILLLFSFTGTGKYKEPYCKYNQLEYTQRSSVWRSIKAAYPWYFAIAFAANYTLLSRSG